MISLVRCCATPDRKAFKLPKRVVRARRVAESKRMDTLRELHEALKKTAQDEHKFVKDFFDKTADMWKDPEEAPESTFDVDEE
jgi:hypothetical protein